MEQPEDLLTNLNRASLVRGRSLRRESRHTELSGSHLRWR